MDNGHWTCSRGPNGEGGGWGSGIVAGGGGSETEMIGNGVTGSSTAPVVKFNQV